MWRKDATTWGDKTLAELWWDDECGEDDEDIHFVILWEDTPHRVLTSAECQTIMDGLPGGTILSGKQALWILAVSG